MRPGPAASAWLLLALALAGCTASPPGGAGGDGGDGGTPPPDAGPFRAVAPWWAVGDAYTVRVERPGAAAVTYRLVNFMNDTATDHFWLGVADRRQALDHALFDTNPFLGRIHHHILTPHERGMHAAMYSFLLVDGKTWTGFFMDGEWSFTTREAQLTTPRGPDRGFRIEGTSTQGDGARITFDYSPAVKWFTKLEKADASGRPTLTATVTAYEQGIRGTFTFLRGRDFYEGPQLAGTHEERFAFNEEVDALAFSVQARSAGPLEVQLIGPSGEVRARASAGPGAQATALEELPAPAQGEWRVRYVATGPIEGRVLVTGLLETKATVTATGGA